MQNLENQNQKLTAAIYLIWLCFCCCFCCEIHMPCVESKRAIGFNKSVNNYVLHRNFFSLSTVRNRLESHKKMRPPLDPTVSHREVFQMRSRACDKLRSSHLHWRQISVGYYYDYIFCWLLACVKKWCLSWVFFSFSISTFNQPNRIKRRDIWPINVANYCRQKTLSW